MSMRRLLACLVLPLLAGCGAASQQSSDMPTPVLSLYKPSFSPMMPSIEIPSPREDDFEWPPIGSESSVAVPDPGVSEQAQVLGIGDLPRLSPSGSPPLRLSTSLRGDAWMEVAVVQLALNATDDAGLDPDGYYGPATEAAVRAFQTHAGIAVDGVVGPDTLKALIDALSKAGGAIPPPVALPSTVPSLPSDFTYYGSTGWTLCSDGTLSSSAGSGTCSWHGGIR